MAKRSVQIGSRCAVSWDVRILDTDYHALDGRPSVDPVRIGDHVWIGSGATVLKGVTIGDGAVVAAGSLVVNDVPAKTLVAGVPARVVRGRRRVGLSPQAQSHSASFCTGPG